MKAIVLPLSFLAWSSLALCATAAADSVRPAIDTMNRTIPAAMKKHDFVGLDKAMRRSMTKDFKYTEAGHSMTYSQMFTELKVGLGAMPVITVAKSELITLKESGGTAIATSKHTIGGPIVGPDHKKHLMMSTGFSTDTYRKEGGKWLMASMTWKDGQTTMDGKPVDMSKMHQAHE